MKKILFAVFLGIVVTVLASWISSIGIKNDRANQEEAKREKIAQGASKQKLLNNLDSYIGNWIGQDNNSIVVTIKKPNGHENEPFYTITITQKGKDTRVISLPINTEGTGVVIDKKGVKYHVDFTKFYQKDEGKFKPSIEIYTESAGSENASEQDIFIRAFKR